MLEGRPHIVDAMKNGEVQLVFNTTEGRQSLEDSLSLRRTALMMKTLLHHHRRRAGRRPGHRRRARRRAGSLAATGDVMAPPDRSAQSKNRPTYLRPRRPARLSTWLAEALRRRRHKRAAYPEVLAYDWSALPYNRIGIVNRLIARAGDDYLEIGCDADLMFKAAMALRKTGVDPRQGGTHRMTSDSFFAAHQDDRFDVVFIDGLHIYDQVRRDIAHALRLTRLGGFVAVHDMIPRDWIEEHVPKISNARWTGDGWKCAFELAATPGVDFRLIAADHGVGVARLLQAGPVLADLGPSLAEARFAEFHHRFDQLPVVDIAEALAWVDGPLVS